MCAEHIKWNRTTNRFSFLFFSFVRSLLSECYATIQQRISCAEQSNVCARTLVCVCKRASTVTRLTVQFGRGNFIVIKVEAANRSDRRKKKKTYFSFCVAFYSVQVRRAIDTYHLLNQKKQIQTNMSYQLYRNTTLGNTLQESLDELIQVCAAAAVE